eukprot:CAMPEP_0196791812 /NCGR_PEP_ID=MMETSP1104-20130614/30396_1 /TAXON_ID=33652 /ORGANISM="Cafeteria sp., Strain Caron Lab Isolate" /LENGTH=87 /DNA_ID=CAMNT_0042162175 /DNA_START=1 /DNA_END=261 /DNA_ORIENTATION=-
MPPPSMPPPPMPPPPSPGYEAGHNGTSADDDEEERAEEADVDEEGEQRASGWALGIGPRATALLEREDTVAAARSTPLPVTPIRAGE